LGAPVGLLLLDLGEDALGEAVAEALQRLLDAAYVDQVAAKADDHASASVVARASSIRRRIVRIDCSRPTKIASPTRKWPIFNSRVGGSAAIGLTVSKVRPWPAWISRPRPAP